MDLGAVVILLAVLAGGFAMGTALNLLRPRDEESAATFEAHRGRVLDRLRASRPSRTSPVGSDSHPVLREPDPALRR